MNVKVPKDFLSNNSDILEFQKTSMSLAWIILFKMIFTPYKTKQPLRDMGLQKKRRKHINLFELKAAHMAVMIFAERLKPESIH